MVLMVPGSSGGSDILLWHFQGLKCCFQKPGFSLRILVAGERCNVTGVF